MFMFMSKCSWCMNMQMNKDIDMDVNTEHVPKVGIRNLSLQLHNMADNQIDCGIAD